MNRPSMRPVPPAPSLAMPACFGRQEYLASGEDIIFPGDAGAAFHIGPTLRHRFAAADAVEHSHHAQAGLAVHGAAVGTLLPNREIRLIHAAAQHLAPQHMKPPERQMRRNACRSDGLEAAIALGSAGLTRGRRGPIRSTGKEAGWIPVSCVQRTGAPLLAGCARCLKRSIHRAGGAVAARIVNRAKPPAFNA